MKHVGTRGNAKDIASQEQLGAAFDPASPGAIGGTTPNTIAGTNGTFSGGTRTTAGSTLVVTETLNASGVTFPGALVINQTHTASAVGSLIADFQAGGVSKSNVRKDGQVSFTSTLRSLDNVFNVYTTDGLIAVLSYDTQFFKDLKLNKTSAVISGYGGDAAAGKAPLTVQGANCGSGQDGITSLTLHGGNASPNATTNITGGITILRGGDGSSGSSGAANGGPVHIAGGLAYGSGVNGNVNLAYTGSAARGAVKCWGTLTMDALLLPKPCTTATRPSWVNGATIFDTDLDKLLIGGVSGWEVVTSS